MTCHRCHEGRAEWLVTSDAMKIQVCNDCAIDARSMQPYGRPRLPGDLTIEPIEGEK